MSVNPPLRDGTQPDDPQQAAEPFSANGDQHGAVPPLVSDEKPSLAAPEPPPATFVSAEAPAAANAPIAPVELRCWCGAGKGSEKGQCASGHDMCWSCGKAPDPARPGRCAGCKKFWYRNQEAKTHGLYLTTPSAADVAARADAVQAAGNPWWRFDWQREMFVEMGDRLDDLLAAMRGKSRALSVPNMKVGMQLLREWNALSAEIAASEPSLPRLADSEHLARVGRVCVKHPQEFAGMLVEAMAAEPGVAAVLRAALDGQRAEPQPESGPAAPVPSVASDKPRAVVPDVVIL